MKSISLTGILTACVAVVLSMSATASADPLACSLAAYKASPGMTATVDGTALTLTWDGEANGEVRMRLAITLRISGGYEKDVMIRSQLRRQT